MDGEFFDKEEVARTMHEIVGALEQEDFLDIIDGRKVDGMRVTK